MIIIGFVNQNGGVGKATIATNLVYSIAIKRNCRILSLRWGGSMGAWYEDPWIEKAGKMVEAFFQLHRDTMPEDPYANWDENEVVYFMLSFVLWNARIKFRLKDRKFFLARAEQYRQNIQSSFEEGFGAWVDGSSLSLEDYETYLSRENEYMSALMKSSPSLFKSIAGSTMKAGCNLFIDNACKRYVFSKKDFVKIISPWLVNKNIEFWRDLRFSHEGE